VSYRLTYRIVLVVVASLLFWSCTTSNEPTANPDPEPTGYYKFDYKTDFSNKADFMGVKNGLIAVMGKMAVGWAEKAETGEDYSVWIRGVSRSDVGSLKRVSYVVELRTPAFFTDGDHIAKRDIVFEYDKESDSNAIANPTSDYIAKQFDRVARNTQVGEAVQRAASNVAVKTSGQYAVFVTLITEYLLTFYPGENDLKYLRTEAIVSGALSYGALKDMIRIEEAKK
jgi:hypothetical protein